MPKSTEKIKLLRGTRANIHVGGKDEDGNTPITLEQGELALDYTDGYLIAGLDENKENNPVNKTAHIVKTNELVGYDSDVNDSNTPGTISDTANGKYAVEYNGTDKSLDILNENGDIDATAAKGVNVTAQNGDIVTEATNGDIKFTNKTNGKKFIVNTNTTIDKDGKQLKVGVVTVDGNTNSYIDVKKIQNTNGSGQIDINLQTNVGDIQGQQVGNKLVTKINDDSDLGIDGIELETNTNTSGTGAKKSTIRTDKLEVDQITNRDEGGDLKLNSSKTSSGGTAGKVVLNEKTSISNTGKDIIITDGASSNEKYTKIHADDTNGIETTQSIIAGGNISATGDNSEISGKNVKTDSIQPKTNGEEVEIDKTHLNDVSYVNGKSGAGIGYWELYATSNDIHEWDAAVTYGDGAVTQTGTTYYKSKVASNKNNNPLTDTTKWEIIPSYNSSTTYTTSGTLVINNGNCYKYIITDETTKKIVKVNIKKGDSDTCENINFNDNIIQATGFRGALDVSSNTTPQIPSGTFSMLRQALLDMVYPVGSIYMSVSTKDDKGNPGNFLGGTWSLLDSGKFLRSTQSNPGTPGGSDSVTLSRQNIPVLSGTGKTELAKNAQPTEKDRAYPQGVKFYDKSGNELPAIPFNSTVRYYSVYYELNNYESVTLTEGDIITNSDTVKYCYLESGNYILYENNHTVTEEDVSRDNYKANYTIQYYPIQSPEIASVETTVYYKVSANTYASKTVSSGDRLVWYEIKELLGYAQFIGCEYGHSVQTLNKAGGIFEIVTSKDNLPEDYKSYIEKTDALEIEGNTKTSRCLKVNADHSHSITNLTVNSDSSNTPVSTVPSYLTCYMWKRIA